MKKSGMYFLITYTHNLSTFQEKLSRFFLKTTFGPTRDMIANWTYEESKLGMARWVKSQMQLPATNHREFFRSHTVPISLQNKINDKGIGIQHPCAPFSRWRKYSFEWYDQFVPFEVLPFEGKFLVVVKGIVRTTMDKFESTDGLVSGAGTYEFCK